MDRNIKGQYGDGVNPEDEPRQVELRVDKLEQHSSAYEDTWLEVPYPGSSESCDLVLPDGIPVERKLLRYWRANGDPEDSMPMRVFSPFHEHTLLSDAQKLHESRLDRDGGLLGLFYKRSDANFLHSCHSTIQLVIVTVLIQNYVSVGTDMFNSNILVNPVGSTRSGGSGPFPSCRRALREPPQWTHPH